MAFLPFSPQRAFSDLTDREVLALAIQNEEEDGRIYREFAERMREAYPASAGIFVGMADEENEHRRRLLELYRQRFGDHIPLIRREDVRGFIRRKPVWISHHLRHRRHARARRSRWRTRRRTSTGAPPREAATRRCARSSATSPTSKSGHAELARTAHGRRHQGAREEERETARRAFVLADHPARPDRPDGRLGLDAGAGVRGRLRHAQQLGDVPGRHGRLGRRRHLHGVRRGAVRRRHAHRPRHALDARRSSPG